MRHLLTALVFTLPLVFSGALHRAIVKANLLPALKRPIDAARFGQNKTWRGLIVMPLLTIPGAVLTQWLITAVRPALTADFGGRDPVLLGAALGLAYVLAELPNSYMKRRLGIAPGKLPEHHRLWFAIGDQSDSALGCMIVFALLVSPPWQVLLVLVLLGPAVHLGANLTLYSLGLRKEPL